MFRVRVDIVNDLNSDDLLEVCGSPDTHVLVRHELPHGNPHYHLWLPTDITDKALRLRLDRKFNLKKTDRSVKICNPERVNEYIQYMFNTKHGNKWELISVRNFDDDLLNDLIKAAKEISTDFDDRNNKKKNTGPTIWDLALEVEREFTKANEDEGNKLRYTGRGRAEDYSEDYENEKYMITIYTDLTIQILRKHRKAFDEFLIRKVISTAMSSHEKGKEILRKKMIKNFSIHY